MHQHRFISLRRLVGYPHVQHRMLSPMYLRKFNGIAIQPDVSDAVRMRLRKVPDFAHDLSSEIKIHQVRFGIGKDSHRFLEMPQCLGVKRHAHRPLLARCNRRLSPVGHGTGTIRLHVTQHQRLVARIGNGIFCRHRMLPFYLSEVVHLRIRRKTGLGNG